MIAQMILYLLILAVAVLAKTSPKQDRFFSICVGSLFFVLCAYFILTPVGESSEARSLVWNSTTAGVLEFEIVSSPMTKLILTPFFLMTALMIAHNLFFPYEVHKKNYTAVLFLNLACLSMLATGQHYIQMITFVFVIDVLSQFFIKNIEAGRCYALYNLIADMSLFGVLALLSGQADTLKISKIQTFRHRDLVAFLLMCALFVKFGFCVLPNYIRDLKNIRFHRLICVSYFSAPPAALILLYKLSPLLKMSHLFLIIFYTVSAIVALIGIVGLLRCRSIKEKTIFLNLILLSFLIQILGGRNPVWTESFSALLVLSLSLNLTLYYLHYYKDRSTSLFLNESQPLGKGKYVLLVGLWCCLSAAFAVKAMALARPHNALWVALALILFSALTSVLFRRSKSHETSLIPAETPLDGRPVPMILILAVPAVFYLHQESSLWPAALVSCGVFLLALKTDCFRFLTGDKKANAPRKESQKTFLTEGLQKFALRGRSLKTSFVVPSSYVSDFGNVSVSLFRRINRLGTVRYAVFTLTALVLFLWCFLRK